MAPAISRASPRRRIEDDENIIDPYAWRNGYTDDFLPDDQFEHPSERTEVASVSSESDYEVEDRLLVPHSLTAASAYANYHLPRPRLPQIRTSSRRDSDTPSLTSSASSLASSSRFSNVPATPISSPSIHSAHEFPSYLDIIEENRREDIEPSPGQNIDPSDLHSPVGPRDGVLPSKHRPRVDSLSNTTTRERTRSPVLSESETVAPTSPSSPGNFRKGNSTSSFGRFLPGSKDRDGDKTRSNLLKSPTREMEKALKAEDKQRQKEAAKVRKEKLARELKARSQAQSHAADRASISSADRKKNETAMYGGMVGFTM